MSPGGTPFEASAVDDVTVGLRGTEPRPTTRTT